MIILNCIIIILNTVKQRLYNFQGTVLKQRMTKKDKQSKLQSPNV